MSRRLRPRPGSVRSKETTGLKTLHEDMKELLESNKMQQLRPSPNILDVPRMRLKRNYVHNFELTVTKGDISSSTSVDVGAAMAFALSDLPNASEITALFDQYRILQVSCKFLPRSVPTYDNEGQCYSVLDYDDNSTVNGTQVVQYDTLQVTPLGQFFERTLNPRFASAAYSGAFTSFANMSNRTWIDVASPGVLYYGIKIFIPTTPVLAVTLTPICTYFIQARASR